MLLLFEMLSSVIAPYVNCCLIEDKQNTNELKYNLYFEVQLHNFLYNFCNRPSFKIQGLFGHTLFDCYTCFFLLVIQYHVIFNIIFDVHAKFYIFKVLLKDTIDKIRTHNNTDNDVSTNIFIYVEGNQRTCIHTLPTN